MKRKKNITAGIHKLFAVCIYTVIINITFR